jgi:protein gp37
VSEKTGISWTHHTFNPWWGCVKVSPACAHCYAERDSKRYGFTVWGPQSERRFFGDDHWKQPRQWNAHARRLVERRRVFCASMADICEIVTRPDIAAQMDQARARLWTLIEETPWLDWLLLTKRPENLTRLLPPAWIRSPQTNVWLMTTVENQQYADLRVPQLLKVPAIVHGVSYEPALGALDLSPYIGPQRRTLTGLDFVIAGGESGPHARPSHPLWFRQVRDACQRAGVAFHFKQWGEYIPLAPIYGTDAHYGDLDTATAGTVNEARCEVLTPHDVWIDGDGQPPSGSWMVERVGKKAAGRVLDGREWQEFPAVLV